MSKVNIQKSLNNFYNISSMIANLTTIPLYPPCWKSSMIIHLDIGKGPRDVSTPKTIFYYNHMEQMDTAYYQ